MLSFQNLLFGSEVIKRPVLTLTVQRSSQQQKQRLQLPRYHVNPDSGECYDEHSSSQELLMPDFPTCYRNRKTQDKWKDNQLKVGKGGSKAKLGYQN